MDHWKPSGPSHPLITAAIAVVLAWTTSLVIFYHGVFYGTVDDTNESIIGLAKLSMAVPIVLTGVSFVAALRDWHSRIVWGTAGLQLFFSCSFFLLSPFFRFVYSLRSRLIFSSVRRRHY